MTRPVIISDEAYAVLCETATAVMRWTGRAVSFAEVLDELLEDSPCGLPACEEGNCHG